MDSDDEMAMHLIMQEEDDNDTEEEESIAILACLAKMQIEEDTNANPKRGGSKFGRRKGKLRMRVEGHCMLYGNYFSEDLRFDEKDFRRRFWMSRNLFMRLVQGVREHDPWFKLKKDVVGTVDFSSIQTCTISMRMIAYGVPADNQDDYLRMSESTALTAMYRFARAVVAVFGPHYLRGPTEQETARILETNKARGWPGMLGSIDCMHWNWKNCPYSW